MQAGVPGHPRIHSYIARPCLKTPKTNKTMPPPQKKNPKKLVSFCLTE
jgi:hypothetical protein